VKEMQNPESETLVYEDGVLVFTGELDGDVDLVIQKDREDRNREVLGLPVSTSPPPNPEV